ncbi:nucleotidyltransferase domain-containing protein [Candidatus Micrarchaeota archaeon]|nr:nucleotidyltransferase domain-containing protein [Candidatus Micrarchaeota archaeon]
MLERLFSSGTRVRVLSLLLFGGRFHLREIARRVGANPTLVKRELDNLAGLGLLECEQVGNLRVFQVNKASPIFEELRKIFLKTELVGSELRKILEQFDVRFALVYGSFAEGREHSGSDVDLLVVGSVKEEELLKSVEKAEALLGREVNYVLWSERELLKRVREKNHFLMNILSGKIIMLVGEELGFREAGAGRARKEKRERR